MAALTRFGGGHAATAVETAVTWALDTQRDDGSWGVWGGTTEETAYAVQILLSTSAHRPQHTRALHRAETYLGDSAGSGRHPALWHDKTLYAPDAMIEAEILAARQTLRTRHDLNRRVTTPIHAEK